MNQEEYLEKLVTDFGEINGYTEVEKREFFDMLKLLISLNENENSLEEIMNLIIK
jgi:hypothetical protein